MLDLHFAHLFDADPPGATPGSRTFVFDKFWLRGFTCWGQEFERHESYWKKNASLQKKDVWKFKIVLREHLDVFMAVMVLTIVLAMVVVNAMTNALMFLMVMMLGAVVMMPVITVMMMLLVISLLVGMGDGNTCGDNSGRCCHGCDFYADSNY